MIRNTVEVDRLRLLREIVPLSRVEKVTFRVVQSSEARCILGQDVLQELERQDEERGDPLQSDVGFDEEKEIERYLEVAMDRAILAGLPKKHWGRYRKLVFVKYKHVFRLRLGKEDPAILPPLEVKTIEGAKLRKGYTIPFNLPPAALEELRQELKTMLEEAGVVKKEG